MITIDFLLTSLVVVLIPGTGVIYTVSTAITQGKSASVYASIGCTLGILPHLVATVLGLAAVMHAGAAYYQVVKMLGVIYLFYLAYSAWSNKSVISIEQSPSVVSGSKTMVKAVLINVLNPKLTMFFMAFLPQFVEQGARPTLIPLLVLSGTFMLMTLVVFMVYGFFAHAFRCRIVESKRIQGLLNRFFATAFAGLGVNLALSE